jgi:hypothetical protein
MATKIICDFCNMEKETIVILEQKEHPHNGDYYDVERDICFDCLKHSKNKIRMEGK